MDYGAILHKSWNVIWKYKILWLFGFFAGAAGGGYNSSYRTGSNSGNNGLPPGMSPADVQMFFERYAGVLIVAALFFIALGLLLWVVSIAARGGLIHLVNEAEEGREVRASAGWHVGFSKWGRLFGVAFLAGIPLFIMAVILGILGAMAVVGAIAASRGSSQALPGAILSAIAGFCVIGGVVVVVAIVLGVIFGIVRELALRYVVLEDRRVMDALKTGWRDLWAKRGSFVMFLVQFGVGIAYGIAASIVSLMFVVPGAMMVTTGNWGGSGLIALGGLIMIVPSAAYGAFYHAAWTIFFRRMTGAEPMPAAMPAPAYPPAAPVAPVYAPVPPAPPAPPVDAVAEPVAAPEPAPMTEPEPESAPEPPAEPPAGADV